MLVTKSTVRLPHKPKNVWQYNEPYSFELADISVEELAAWLSSGGFFKAGIYNIEECKSRKVDRMVGEQVAAIMGKQFAQGSQIICLDFDSCEQTPAQVVDVLAGKGLLPNFMYYSYSQDPEKNSRENVNTIYIYYSINENPPKNSYKNGYNFRLVWCLSDVLNNDEYESIYCKLLDFCAEQGVNPDPATKDISRVWWGGVLGYELYSDEPVNIKASLGWQEIAARASKSANSKLRQIVNAKNAFISEYKDEVEFPESVEVGNEWWTKLRGVCGLWDRYEAGEYLNHNERLTLFTNLKFLKRSNTHESIYKDVMQFYNPDVWASHTFNERQLKSWLSNQSLGAYPICRTPEGYKTIADFLSKDWTKPRKFVNQNKVTLVELDAWLDENIPHVLDDEECNYFKSQTASGKTERIIDYLINQDFTKKYIVALPYLSLIEEFAERWYEKTNRELFAQPTEFEYTDMDLARLHLGLGKESKFPEKTEFIRHMQMDEETSGGTYVVTHTTLLSLPYVPCQRIIIDENIEDALVHEYVFSKAQLRTITDYIPASKRHYIEELCERIDETESGDIDISCFADFLTEFEKNITDYIDEVPQEVQPAGIFNCRNATIARKCKEGMRVTIKTPLIEDAMADNTPITLFTATPQPSIIRDLYGSAFNIIEAPFAANEGKIIQFRTKSGARGLNNANLPDLFETVKKTMLTRYDRPLSEYYLLTFKLAPEFQEKVEEMGFRLPRHADGTQIHIDNCAGLDRLKGEQVIVAAKKDLPPDCYLKMYEDITGETTDHLDMNKHIIRHCGVDFCCYLYNDSRIRSRQMEYINRLSAQAIGRARALREKEASVYYFSDYPVNDVDEIYN